VANARVNQNVFEIATLLAANARVTQNVFEIAVLNDPPVITCGNPPQGTINVPYSHFFPVAAGLAPFTFSIIVPALPVGLSLNAATGEVSGTPTVPGNYNFTIAVTDSNLLTSEVACAINIVGGLIRITFRGVKRTRVCAADPKLSDVPTAPSVKRAV